jgi:hypothetical protein
MRLTWQNLNDDERGRPKGWPYHGRAWMRGRSRGCARVEWNLWSRSCGLALGVERDTEDTATWMVAFPPIALYFGLDLPRAHLLARFARRICELSSDMKSDYSGSELSLRARYGGVSSRMRRGGRARAPAGGTGAGTLWGGGDARATRS